MRIDDLEEEGGITEVSLNNARKLIHRMGTPGQLYFEGDRAKGEYFVTAFWSRTDKWVFSGFGWSYRGTGPAGFLQFLQMCGQSEAEANLTLQVLEARMEADKWHKTASSKELCPEFTRRFGWL